MKVVEFKNKDTEKKEAFEKLLLSIREFNPERAIVILDDSEDIQCIEFNHTSVLTMLGSLEIAKAILLNAE